jgi:hypothetical protein
MEDYTLFEMYEHVYGKGKIECPMSWDTLADIALKLQIIPKELGDCKPPLWVPEMSKYDELSICIRDKNGKVLFRIMQSDIIIMPDGSRYAIDELYYDDKDDVDAGIYYMDDDIARDMLVVSLLDLETQGETKMKAWDFLLLVDCENIVYESSLWLDYVAK